MSYQLSTQFSHFALSYQLERRETRDEGQENIFCLLSPVSCLFVQVFYG